MVDTIFALSSGAVPSGVAIIRISGPSTVAVFGSFTLEVPTARQAVLRNLEIDGEIVDSGLVLFFPGPHSFTGEDVAELHLHGSPAVVSAVLSHLSALEGFRAAEPGEFTRRAFANGRMDLTEAESLAQLIESETEAQRRLAMGGAAGEQRSLIRHWQDELTVLRARLEAEIDFSDEADVPEDVSKAARQSLEALTAQMERHLASFRGAEIIRRGFRVALAGRPNAGKSSLLNRFAGRDVAIVTDIAGTTRDRLEVSLDIQGYKVVLVDLAGLRETEDLVERVGVELAHMTVAEADLVLWMDEEGHEPPWQEEPSETLKVLSKADSNASVAPDEDWLAVSSCSGEGIDSLLDAIAERLKDQVPATDLLPPATERQRDQLSMAIRHCKNAIESWDKRPVELIAEDLRAASFALGRIVGQVDAEQLLDDIFARFCIGK
ncbi:tRNA uridine-5-carboxymethylaminomethyl(34) synthesis GTPase MnmE [Notoacmeibacter ruber]|uniref:tRNA modification GTPase MnmE n=1 Tax=Notoacmeibacter ruber TaxID=2670375 RepID=A0A3L7JEE5_9HYPH|nr:tRNA uridine-5-carboxymethylaminomethyl(34) synthesis GTPase MnmE [Notoacmeibacter ruber]RLQ89147.1 tRNA uridine-5-carboxymethylaminomethyl(34) synthesis GTPase MnmE [Notoacmeibacter ruber]